MGCCCSTYPNTEEALLKAGVELRDRVVPLGRVKGVVLYFVKPPPNDAKTRARVLQGEVGNTLDLEKRAQTLLGGKEMKPVCLIVSLNESHALLLTTLCAPVDDCTAGATAGAPQQPNDSGSDGTSVTQAPKKYSDDCLTLAELVGDSGSDWRWLTPDEAQDLRMCIAHEAKTFADKSSGIDADGFFTKSRDKVKARLPEGLKDYFVVRPPDIRQRHPTACSDDVLFDTADALAGDTARAPALAQQAVPQPEAPLVQQAVPQPEAPLVQQAVPQPEAPLPHQLGTPDLAHLVVQ